MQNSKSVGLSLGAAAVLLAFLMLVLYLWHEKDHDKTDYTAVIVIVALALLTIALTAFAVYRNLKDAHRAESLQAQIITIKDDCKTQIEGTRAECNRRIVERSKQIETIYEALHVAQVRHVEAVEELEGLKACPRRLLGNVVKWQAQIQVVGVLEEHARQADALLVLLEEVRQLYNNDKTEILQYPLEVGGVPATITEWRHKELWRFRTLYQAHIKAVQVTTSGFHTALVNFGFPCNNPYQSVKDGLSDHARALREESFRMLHSFLDAKVEI